MFARIRFGLAAGAVALAAVVFTQGTASAEDARAFYKGKVVKMIVGYGPGGGYDAYARMIAPHLSKALGATVIVENQPGAGGLNALNRLYVATPDGLQTMIVNGTGAALAQILHQKAVRFDLGKLGYLASVSSSPWIWLATPNSPINTPADAMKPGVKLRWAASGVTDGLGDGAAITCHVLKLDCQIIRGYKGSSAAAHAVTQGEMDSIYVSDTSANKYVKAKGAKAVATMSRDKSRFFPNLPTIFELIKPTGEQEWWLDFRATLDGLGRILVTSPNLPKDRLAFLQAAVKKVLTDKAVVAEGERTQRYLDYGAPEATEKNVLKVVGSLTADQTAAVQKVIMGK